MTTDTNGISKLDLKRQNRMHILRLLRNNGPTSRIDIAREIKITKAAVTIITNEMIEQGILYEKGEMLPRGNKVPRGRKKILLDIDDAYRLGLGLTLDSGTVTMGICTLKGKPVERQSAGFSRDCSAGKLIATIREMYDDIAYKNDLKSGTVAGMGVCVSEDYFPLLGITRDENGRADYAALENALRDFSDLPLVFGSLADGIAMAEIDYHNEGEVPPVNMVAFRCDRDLECAVVTGRELYQGSIGRPASPGRMNGDNGSVLARIFGELSEAGVNSSIKALFEGGGCPILRAQALEDQEEFFRLFRMDGFLPEDPPVEEALRQISAHYQMMLECFATFYAPDRIVCFGDNAVESALAAAIERVNESCPQVKDGLVRRSIISSEDSYRAAAAMATREFFINKGGY